MMIPRLSGSFANLCLYSSSKLHHAQSLVRSGFVVVDKSVGETIVSGSQQVTCACKTVRNRRSQFFTHIRHCSVKTELIDGNNSAKNHLNSQ